MAPVDIFWLPGGPRDRVTPLRAHVLCSSGLAIALEPVQWTEAAVLVPEERAVMPPPVVVLPPGKKRKPKRRG